MRTRRADHREQFWHWAQWLMASSLGGSALILGGAHVWVTVPVVALLALAATLGFASGKLRRLPVPSLIVIALGVYSLLQSIPLPIALLRHVSPRAAEIWSRSLSPFGQLLGYGSISLDPGASTVEAARWIAYGLCFALAAAIAKQEGPRWVPMVVFGSALLVAVATVAHGLVGATRVFGIYEPTFGPSRWHIGPILNPNSLAGYLNLGVFCGLGFTFSGRTNVPRWLYATGVAVIFAVTVLSGSRGGVIALFLGLLVFVAILARSPFANERLRRLDASDWLALLGAVAVGVTFVFLGASGSSLPELFQKDVEKLKLSGWVLPMLRDYVAVGIGRGAFESVFPEYRAGATNIVYSHPENLVVQWISEWGVAIGGGALVALVWVLRPAVAAARKRVTTIGAMVAVAALVLSNFADLGLELTGPALAIAALLGSCWASAETSDSRGRDPSSWWGRSWTRRAAMCWLCFACVGLSLWRGMRTVSADRIQLRELYAGFEGGEAVAKEEFWTELRGAMLRHPGEAYFPRLGALAALKSAGLDPMQWINRALERCLTNGRTHLILAHALVVRGVLHQALLEARLAVDYDPALASSIGAAVARWTDKPEEMAKAAPSGEAGGRVMLAAAKALEDVKDAGKREQLLRFAIDRDPKSIPARRSLARQLLAEMDSERCTKREGVSCADEVVKQGRALDALDPTVADGVETLAHLWIHTKQTGEAEHMLRERCPRFEDMERVRCLTAMLGVLRLRGDREAVIRGAQDLVKIACTLEQACQKSLVNAGDASAGVGDQAGALAFFERAARRDPSPGLLLKVADMAVSLGRPAVAERALQLAAARAGSNGGMRAQIAQRREVLLRRAIE